MAGFTLVMIEGVGWGPTVAGPERLSRQLRGVGLGCWRERAVGRDGVKVRDGFGV
jgi:hypothetical protein